MPYAGVGNATTAGLALAHPQTAGTLVKDWFRDSHRMRRRAAQGGGVNAIDALAVKEESFNDQTNSLSPTIQTLTRDRAMPIDPAGNGEGNARTAVCQTTGLARPGARCSSPSGAKIASEDVQQCPPGSIFIGRSTNDRPRWSHAIHEVEARAG